MIGVMLMDVKNGDLEWASLSRQEKNQTLYNRQLALLDTLLEKGAITKEQYAKSRHDLTEKMGN